MSVIVGSPRPRGKDVLLQGLAEGAASSLQQSLAQFHQQRQLEKEGQDLEKLGLRKELAGKDPQIIREAYKQEQKRNFLAQILGGNPQSMANQGSPFQGMPAQEGESRPNITDEQILALSAVDPNLSRTLQQQKEFQDRNFQKERQYHTQFSQKAEEHADKLRESLPKVDNALNLGRASIESGEVGAFSKANLASRTGIKEFQTAKGATLSTAGKEHLFNNMARLAAKAQNVYMEQRTSAMFPQIGQSKEANLTTQEILEGERFLDTAYLNKFDQLANDDMEKYGYVKKDIDRRARKATGETEQLIANRQSYRMREIEENEKGNERLMRDINKKVVEGTPLTLRMGNLFYQKYGEKAIEEAKKRGYRIPSVNDLEIYNLTPQQFREIL